MDILGEIVITRKFTISRPFFASMQGNRAINMRVLNVATVGSKAKAVPEDYCLPFKYI